ncbi:MAG: adenylate/guanylate cyclase domain-containing protein [Deltaproteobacteria bacterium]|nr:adenylate/guanylate cyclase domain-containing protein [Deltaproteobacteria bacterium]
MRWKITILNTVGNLIGALLTFLYLNYLDVGGHQYSGEDPSLPYMIYFVIGTGSIFVMVILFVQHWTRPLYAFTAGNIQLSDLDPYAAKQLRKKALQLVPVMTAASLFGWLMAGFIFGMFMPIIMTMFFGLPETSLTESMRTFFGIFFIGGSITGLFVYFSTESVWRKGLSAFFPEGDLSQVRGAFRLNVKTRLVVVFLMISLIPLLVLSISAYTKASALLSADLESGKHIISALLIQIIFITSTGTLAAILLSLIVSKSVSEPIKEMERAMQEVARGNLNININVVSNDEIGALGEGLGNMVNGLKASEVIKESFGKYISEEIRDEILSGRVPLDGEMKRATLLFSDLRDFTPFVESTHPKQVVAIMNQYFSEMAKAIKENNGLILQFVGDEIEAVFGAPVYYDDHPDMAIRAALDMQKRLVTLNQRLKAQNVKPIRHGIGVHTGAVLAGIIGSKERSSYALVGDTVNLASRIQELTKDFSCEIILSQTTHDLITGSYAMQQLSAMKVKGKSQEVMVYKLLGQNQPPEI